MNFFFLEIRLVLHQIDGLFNMFVSFRCVAVFEATQGNAIVRVVILSIHGQCELVPGHSLCKFKLIFITICKVYHRIVVFLILKRIIYWLILRVLLLVYRSQWHCLILHAGSGHNPSDTKNLNLRNSTSKYPINKEGQYLIFEFMIRFLFYWRFINLYLPLINYFKRPRRGIILFILGPYSVKNYFIIVSRLYHS